MQRKSVNEKLKMRIENPALPSTALSAREGGNI